ncbi:hypothetical protein DWG18_02265 [Lysobacter sp. TY2-98]|nr:hypothetical protein DWG18_02265 [Lysobacter sp. TY2-98]
MAKFFACASCKAPIELSPWHFFGTSYPITCTACGQKNIVGVAVWLLSLLPLIAAAFATNHWFKLHPASALMCTVALTLAAVLGGVAGAFLAYYFGRLSKLPRWADDA